MSARRAALRILSEVRAGRPFEEARNDAVAALAERDRRLAHELAAGVLRNQTALDQTLARFASRRLDRVDPPVLDLLRLGAYQLTGLDRVPVHAAVSTAASLAREVGGKGAAGFANAVLRRVASDHAPPEPESGGTVDTARSLADAYSHPGWLVERWLDRFGPQETEALLRWNNTRPALVVQPARESLERLAEVWRAHGVESRPAPYGAGLIVNVGSPRELPGFEAGAFIVQDPAQALVTRFADLAPGTRLYDACAAPGGKAIALGRGVRAVVAGERRFARAPRLAENLRRAGSGHEFAVVADAAAPPVRPMDAVLLDVPCLGTGTFARHPDARWRVRPEALRRLALDQVQLLEAAGSVVKPGGVLIYSTCSLEPEENELQVDRFLAAHPEFGREPGAAPGELLSAAGDLHVLPQRHGTDGAFAARLRRTA